MPSAEYNAYRIALSVGLSLAHSGRTAPSWKNKNQEMVTAPEVDCTGCHHLCGTYYRQGRLAGHDREMSNCQDVMIRQKFSPKYFPRTFKRLHRTRQVEFHIDLNTGAALTSLRARKSILKIILGVVEEKWSWHSCGISTDRIVKDLGISFKTPRRFEVKISYVLYCDASKEGFGVLCDAKGKMSTENQRTSRMRCWRDADMKMLKYQRQIRNRKVGTRTDVNPMLQMQGVGYLVRQCYGL
ncbi:hypothetical protein Tco_1069343 [Tanacetum coccineum]|uniref:Reverse transcriptase/retrotransposon-derived protein RNase H-like domain-containing protein n=1 Tax=Tanacetum coccineum TaxID=301880 RepID=A0ABQ5HJN6_9ASTR